jgi:hypothetical protein
MGIKQDSLLMVKAQICGQIDVLTEHLPLAQAGSFAAQVDDIRRTAHDNGLSAVADIAHALETALARSAGVNTVRPYLEAMRDATECQSADPSIISAYLASISQRLHN